MKKNAKNLLRFFAQTEEESSLHRNSTSFVKTNVWYDTSRLHTHHNKTAGVVERRNRTLLEIARSLLQAKNVSNFLWGEAIWHATYIINRLPTKALKNSTPCEKFYHRNPNIEHLWISGSLAYVKITTPQQKKLDDQTKKIVNFVSKPGSKSYLLYDLKLQKRWCHEMLYLMKTKVGIRKKKQDYTKTHDVLGSLAEVGWHRK